MKRNVPRRIRFVALTLLFSVCSLFSVGRFAARQVHAAQNSALHLRVEAGFQGHFREGDWVPILVNVSNDGPDVNGELRVVPTNSVGSAPGAYTTAIDLPTQSSKQLFLYATLESYTQEIQVDLTDVSGTALISATLPMSRADVNDLLYAVVTESPTGSVDLTGTRRGQRPILPDRLAFGEHPARWHKHCKGWMCWSLRTRTRAN